MLNFRGDVFGVCGGVVCVEARLDFEELILIVQHQVCTSKKGKYQCSRELSLL